VGLVKKIRKKIRGMDVLLTSTDNKLALLEAQKQQMLIEKEIEHEGEIVKVADDDGELTDEGKLIVKDEASETAKQVEPLAEAIKGVDAVLKAIEIAKKVADAVILVQKALSLYGPGAPNQAANLLMGIAEKKKLELVDLIEKDGRRVKRLGKKAKSIGKKLKKLAK
tara:strand:+ start:193 stop:693 length:501 start_codon:yes stop_codon:yes gene_type:complete